WGVREATVREVARGWQPATEILLWLKQRARNDSNEFVRGAALQEIVRGWKSDPDTLPLLKDIAQNDTNSFGCGSFRTTASH
ncbi:MAG TPA: HEAT repeat domain-containing protein, partial [Gemmatimonadaceae bacterium]|nr:HEAT repeat domain-containing protein [Gemmatimonadaceae bacterium]